MISPRRDGQVWVRVFDPEEPSEAWLLVDLTISHISSNIETCSLHCPSCPLLPLEPAKGLFFGTRPIPTRCRNFCSSYTPSAALATKLSNRKTSCKSADRS